jgi:hypothetical protein
MKDLVELFIARPLAGLTAILLMAVIYLFVGLGSISNATAGLEVKAESWANAHSIILDMNERQIRMDQNLINLNKEK